MCRRWNWRNGHLSRIRPETTNLVMNIDGLGAECEPMVIKARDRVAEMLAEFCNDHVTMALLTPISPTFTPLGSPTRPVRNDLAAPGFELTIGRGAVLRQSVARYGCCVFANIAIPTLHARV